VGAEVRPHHRGHGDESTGVVFALHHSIVEPTDGEAELAQQLEEVVAVVLVDPVSEERVRYRESQPIVRELEPAHALQPAERVGLSFVTHRLKSFSPEVIGSWG
jgi:hypothetical protein